MSSALGEVERGEEEVQSKQEKSSLESILGGRWIKGKQRDEGLKRLAMLLKELQSGVGFKVSARGWCYQLENENRIDKSEFDRAEAAINDCRRLGYLPIDFCAQDATRVWDVELPTEGSVEDFFKLYARAACENWKYYIPDWWDGEEYYIQMLVEKVDLKTLFQPVCKNYHIPIANAHGWSDINERAEMAMRFRAAEERGQECVLLYCGDHDPWGLRIESGLRDNLTEISAATGYIPSNLKIDRFGLNYEFIEENDLTWIDNLVSSSGKDMSKSSYCYNCDMQYGDGVRKCRNCHKGMYTQPQFVKDYIAKYGVRKCEANALVIVPEQAMQLAEDAITTYLGLDSGSRFEAKQNKIKRQFQRFMRKYPVLFNELERQAG
ncbi:MAG TPA: hypothetical protein VFG77_06575 [Nitrososphaeraceae archaeon]|nr:hypothetical protein [Nitrososphaeraceae archaeon]